MDDGSLRPAKNNLNYAVVCFKLPLHSDDIQWLVCIFTFLFSYIPIWECEMLFGIFQQFLSDCNYIKESDVFLRSNSDTAERGKISDSLAHAPSSIATVVQRTPLRKFAELPNSSVTQIPFSVGTRLMPLGAAQGRIPWWSIITNDMESPNDKSP